MKKFILSLVIVPLFAVALIGCGSDTSTTDVDSNDPEVAQTEEAADVNAQEDEGATEAE